MVNYLRGDQSNEGSSLTAFRARQHLLGDIVNAEPVIVNYADGASIVFQGANDGMLHVVDGRATTPAGTTDGQELWAYVPRLLHSTIGELASQSYGHRYYVDGTPTAVQLTNPSTGAATTRLLVGGLGKGGRGYYALNISSYEAASVADAASKVMWEFGAGLANMGYSFGKPLIVRTAAGWRVVVTSGYDNGTTTGGDGRGYVWVLDPADGTILHTFATGVGTASNPSGLAHLSTQANTATDALVQYVYGGDLYGNVWRFDLNSTGSAPVKIAETRDGANAVQPITSPVQVGPVPGSLSRLFVYVGTGRYLSDEDVPGNPQAVAALANQRQSLYGFVDDTSQASPALPNVRGSNGYSCPTNGGTNDLVCQTLTYSSGAYDASYNAVDLATKRGWYLDWPDDARLSNGRVTGQPALTKRGTLALTVNVPKDETCQPGGSSWFFALASTTGGAVPKQSPGNDYFDDAGTSLGDGLASRVVLIETTQGTKGQVITSDGQN